MALITGAAEAQQSTKRSAPHKDGLHLHFMRTGQVLCSNIFKQADSLINVGTLFNRALNSELSITDVGTVTTVNT